MSKLSEAALLWWSDHPIMGPAVLATLFLLFVIITAVERSRAITEYSLYPHGSGDAHEDDARDDGDGDAE
jgi:hypothetical protein